MMPWSRNQIFLLVLLAFCLSSGAAQGTPNANQGSSPLTRYSAVAIHPWKDIAENGEAEYSNSTADGVVFRGATLETLLTSAFGVLPNQIAGIPRSMSGARFDITAKVDPEDVPAYRNMTPAQRRVMLQSLLKDRFGLAFHHDPRPLRVYELVIAQKGINQSRTRLRTPSGTITATSAGRGHLEAKDAPVSDLAEMLTAQLGRLVLDKTGLQGYFDYSLSWDAEEDRPAPALSPAENADTGKSGDRGSIFSALVAQLGLKLESKTDPVDTIVVDRVTRPTEN